MVAFELRNLVMQMNNVTLFIQMQKVLLLLLRIYIII